MKLSTTTSGILACFFVILSAGLSAGCGDPVIGASPQSSPGPSPSVGGTVTVQTPPDYTVTIEQYFEGTFWYMGPNGVTAFFDESNVFSFAHYSPPSKKYGNYGGNPETYQWYWDGVQILNGGVFSGAQTNTLTIVPTVAAVTASVHELMLTVKDANGLLYSGSVAATVESDY